MLRFIQKPLCNAERSSLTRAIDTIKDEFTRSAKFFREHDKLLEAQRIEQRTRYDLEMMQQLGIPMVSETIRHLSGPSSW